MRGHRRLQTGCGHPEGAPGYVSLLAGHFLGHFRQELGRPGLSFAEGALEYLESQPWPGNVRESINRIERAAILAEGPIGPENLQGPSGAGPPRGRTPAPDGPDDPEAWLAEEARWRAAELLRRCQGDIRRASRILGIRQDQYQRLLQGSG